MRNGFVQTVVLLIFLIVNTVTAEQITIDDVRALALANSSALAGFNLKLESARLEERSRIFGNLPSVSLGVSASGQIWGEADFRDSVGTGASFILGQTLFDGGKSIYQKAINAITSGQIRQEALAAYFTVLDTADSAYYEMLKAAAAVETAKASRETAALALSMAELRRESGMINQRDYLKAMADRGTSETAWNRALKDLAVSKAQLKNITGLDEIPEPAAVDLSVYENTIEFLSNLPEEKIVLLTEIFSNAAMANNPDILKSNLALQLAERNVGLAKRDYIPTLSASVSAGINYSPTGGLSVFPTGSLSITGKIPLDYWVIGTAVQKKRIAQTEAAMEYRDAEKNLAVTIQTALLDLIYNALSVQSARQADEYARQNYEYNMELYKLSRASVFELSDAAKSAGDNHTQRITAEYGFLSGLSKLRSLCAFGNQDEVINLLLSRKNEP